MTSGDNVARHSAVALADLRLNGGRRIRVTSRSRLNIRPLPSAYQVEWKDSPITPKRCNACVHFIYIRLATPFFSRVFRSRLFHFATKSRGQCWEHL